jgi:hypothetical protein
MTANQADQRAGHVISAICRDTHTVKAFDRPGSARIRYAPTSRAYVRGRGHTGNPANIEEA